jgi:hypothetical protein
MRRRVAHSVRRTARCVRTRVASPPSKEVPLTKTRFDTATEEVPTVVTPTRGTVSGGNSSRDTCSTTARSRATTQCFVARCERSPAHPLTLLTLRAHTPPGRLHGGAGVGAQRTRVASVAGTATRRMGPRVLRLALRPTARAAPRAVSRAASRACCGCRDDRVRRGADRVRSRPYRRQRDQAEPGTQDHAVPPN